VGHTLGDPAPNGRGPSNPTDPWQTKFVGKRTERAECPVCRTALRSDRVPPYCSKKCQAEKEGYSQAYVRELDRLKARVEGTTAWRPQPLEAVHRVLSARPIVIFSDLHLPMHSKEWVLHGIQCAKSLGASKLILNGDVMDLNQISRHMGSYYRRKSELEDDFSSTEAFLKLVCEEFEEVVWLSGNHCIQRLIQLFRGEASAGRLLKIVGDHANLKVTARSFVDVNDHVRICHPRQYSKIRGATPARLAQRWQMHIAVGHEHHSAMTASNDGKWQAVCIPSMVDSNLQDYVRNELTDHAEPMQGFAVVFGNSIQVFDRFTPWKYWGLPEYEGP
jgi:hypothetical protein